MNAVVEVVAAVLLLAGCGFALFAGIGLLRFPDLLSRLHAGTKPQVTSLLLVFTGTALLLADTSALGAVLLAAVLQLLTAPVSAHLVARVAYRRRHVRADLLLVHETGFRGLEEHDESLPDDAASGDGTSGDGPPDAPPSGGHPSPREG